MSIDRSYTFAGTSTRRLQQIFNFREEKNTRGSYPSLNYEIRLKIGQGALHLRRYTEVSLNLGSKACTLFHLGTDGRYTYVSVGFKCTLSAHLPGTGKS